jgi:hypothetical protein
LGQRRTPHQLILQIDAWNIRERDHWGETAAQRKRGAEPERWHWVYTGTCFRLDHRAQTASGRPVIVERGFVATREGIDALREQLHAEARRPPARPDRVLDVGGDNGDGGDPHHDAGPTMAWKAMASSATSPRYAPHSRS